MEVNIMKKISKLINRPITWKQSFIAAAIGMILSLIVIVVECVSLNKKESILNFHKYLEDIV